jgi:hypothetical protein
MSEWYLTLTAISLPLSSLWAASTPDGTVTRPSVTSGGTRPSFANVGTTFASSGTRSFGSSGGGGKLLDAGGLGRSRNESIAPLSPFSGEKGWKESV